jgi:teichuronic acid biosynthesis glycosyltransferase TuaC
MHVLEMSYMYPSPRHPTSGVFVERLVRELARSVRVDVVSPVPWAPRALWRLSSRWRAYGRQPRAQVRHGIAVHHPRYLQPVGQWSVPLTGRLMAAGMRATVARLVARHGVDVIHAHQLLPDGLAAVLLGRRFARPVVCTLHGSDVHLLPFHDRLAQRAAARVAREARALVAVGPGLLASLRRLGTPHAPVDVIPNGVDTEQFQPRDRDAARARLGLAGDGRLVVYVGMLAPVKGVDVLVRAFARLVRVVPDARLVLVGGGGDRNDRDAAVARLAGALGVGDRVRVTGRRPHDEVPLWLAAADVMALASRSEGFPTVVREAVACGTPCVVSDLPGLADEIGPACGTECGVLVPVGDVDGFAAALAAALARPWDRAALRRRALAWRWERTAADTLRVLGLAATRPRMVA